MSRSAERMILAAALAAAPAWAQEAGPTEVGTAEVGTTHALSGLGAADGGGAAAPGGADAAGTGAPGGAPGASHALAGLGTDGSGTEGAAVPREGGFGLGRAALAEEVAAWDIDVRPDGAGLPPGAGDVRAGEEVYLDLCASCHGDFGEGAGRWPVLMGGFGTLDGHDPVKTVGSYWPYLSTVWDYVHRAMPFGSAQILTDDEVYAVTAYLLYLNDLVPDDFVLSQESFARVEMPNRGDFLMDDREKTERAAFTREPCMTDCAQDVRITKRAMVIDVTPEDGAAGGID